MQLLFFTDHELPGIQISQGVMVGVDCWNSGLDLIADL